MFNKNRIICLLKKKNNLTVAEIANYLSLSYDNTKKHLRELYYDNKIKKIVGCGPIPNKWFIKN